MNELMHEHFSNGNNWNNIILHSALQTDKLTTIKRMITVYIRNFDNKFICWSCKRGISTDNTLMITYGVTYLWHWHPRLTLLFHIYADVCWVVRQSCIARGSALGWRRHHQHRHYARGGFPCVAAHWRVVSEWVSEWVSECVMIGTVHVCVSGDVFVLTQAVFLCLDDFCVLVLRHFFTHWVPGTLPRLPPPHTPPTCSSCTRGLTKDPGSMSRWQTGQTRREREGGREEGRGGW